MTSLSDKYPSCDKFKNIPNCCVTEKTIFSLQNKKNYNKFENNSNKAIFVGYLLGLLYFSRPIYNLIRARKMVRKYYNEFKNFCTVLDLSLLKRALVDTDRFQNCNVRKCEFI